MNRWQIHAASLLLMATAAGPGANPACAGDYPDKPIRMLLPFPPGGGTDSLARIVLPRLSAALGQPLVIDNRAGAGGNLAAEIVVKAAPDGHTLLMGSSTGMTAAQSLYKLPFDPVRDLAAITQFATAWFILILHPSVPVKNVAELVALAKAKPGGLNYSSGGIGSQPHLAAELFKSRAGVDIVHIAYKGGGPAALAVIGGEAQLMFGSFSASFGQIKAGKLNAIAVTSLKRLALTPELPTLHESGFPGYEVATWASFEAPRATPRSIVRRIQGETVQIVRTPEVVATMNKIGYTPTGTTPEQYAEIKRSESEMWAKVIKQANIRAE
jgi:tripartite-type tricarboxylate transporter receptor subunit TctC